jgi:predicted lipoprotein with Yx(FWY)xxD motif
MTWEEAMGLARQFGVAAAFILGACSQSSTPAEDFGTLQVMETSLGPIMADANGMTLYTYDEDGPGKSNCVDQCAVNWPPAIATAADKPVGDLTIIARPDGTLQWADEGKPLYTFVQDKKPGDVTGDNMKGVWHVVPEAMD